MIKHRIGKLRDQFIKYNIDGYVVPKMMNFFQNIQTKIGLKLYLILLVQLDMQ